MCLCNYRYFGILPCKTGLEFYLPWSVSHRNGSYCFFTNVTLRSGHTSDSFCDMNRVGRGVVKARDHPLITLQKPPLRSSKVHTAVPAHSKQFKLHFLFTSQIFKNMTVLQSLIFKCILSQHHKKGWLNVRSRW